MKFPFTGYFPFKTWEMYDINLNLVVTDCWCSSCRCCCCRWRWCRWSYWCRFLSRCSGFWRRSYYCCCRCFRCGSWFASRCRLNSCGCWDRFSCRFSFWYIKTKDWGCVWEWSANTCYKNDADQLENSRQKKSLEIIIYAIQMAKWKYPLLKRW